MYRKFLRDCRNPSAIICLTSLNIVSTSNPVSVRCLEAKVSRFRNPHVPTQSSFPPCELMSRVWRNHSNSLNGKWSSLKSPHYVGWYTVKLSSFAVLYWCRTGSQTVKNTHAEGPGGKCWGESARERWKHLCNYGLYNSIEFAIHMKLARLIKMCLNETYSKVRIGKHLSETFPIQNGLKQGDALSPLLFNFALEYASRKL
jgi:hypothetical protein